MVHSSSPTRTPGFFSMTSRITVPARWIRFAIGWMIGVMIVDFFLV